LVDCIVTAFIQRWRYGAWFPYEARATSYSLFKGGKKVAPNIFAIQHFQSNIETKKLLRDGFVADPFDIAQAAVTDAAVVTIEACSQQQRQAR
jgi:hypothetical protein